MADFDSDGTPDVAVASQTANTVTILRGGTVPEPPIALSGEPYGIAAADFNADSRPDLAVSANTAGSFTALLNTTQPPPPPEQPPPPAAPPAQQPLPEPVAGQMSTRCPSLRHRPHQGNRAATVRRRSTRATRSPSVDGSTPATAA